MGIISGTGRLPKPVVTAKSLPTFKFAATTLAILRFTADRVTTYLPRRARQRRQCITGSSLSTLRVICKTRTYTDDKTKNTDSALSGEMTTIADYYDHSNPTTSLRLSQKSAGVLSKSSFAPFPLSLISAAETPDDWAELEQTFYACLRTGDDKAAHLCMERLTTRFGAGNERVVAIRGLYQEAVAENDQELQQVVQEYNKILNDNPMNIPIHKRRIALVRSLGRPQEAIAALVQFLESFPTDTEAWCELSDLYHTQGLYAQAIYSLEEALLTVPNAWNLQARLGELNYMASQSGAEGLAQQYMDDSIHRFSRSIELCDDYLRGYYGLKKATDKALAGSNKTGAVSQDDLRKLNKLATDKLQAIVQQWSSQKQKGTTSTESEIIAAQALLDES